MENKFINRYNTFCKSLSNLAKSKTADPKTILFSKELFSISVLLSTSPGKL